jgi:N-terminal acetyltransferase B complex catalytic subunit
MTSYRRMKATDLFMLSAPNLDRFTENYDRRFYTNYFLRWPEYNVVACSMDGRPIAYVMGKSEGEPADHRPMPGEDPFAPIPPARTEKSSPWDEWHGHVTVLTVAPAYRRLGIASRLMSGLESACEQGKMRFVDLYVRKSNVAARDMYARMGYQTYRTVTDYYGSPREDALDMRKPLSSDPKRLSLSTKRRVVHAAELR